MTRSRVYSYILLFLVVAGVSYIMINGENSSQQIHRVSHQSASEFISRGLSESSFGILESLTPDEVTVSIILIVFAVLFVEHSFELLNHITHDTPFEDMMHAIQREMMIVGCMAFVFKIVINCHLIENEKWILCLEFADLLVPITSFCFCIEGMWLIIVVIRQFDVWNRAYHLSFVELLDDYLSNKHLSIIQRFHWIPLSDHNSGMEFRVFHDIFCDQYDISRQSFAFNEYVQRVFESFLLNLVSIRFVDWMLVCVLALLNWARMSGGVKASHCPDEDEYCVALAGIKIYTYFGVLILIATLILAFFSRIYELRIMATRGIHSGEDYIPYLKVFSVWCRLF